MDKVVGALALLEGKIQVFRFDRPSVGENHGAFDGVLQLADVSGPGVLFESTRGFGAELKALPMKFAREFLDEELGERPNVGHAFAQGRVVERKNRQPEEES